MSGIGYKAHGDRIALASRILINLENALEQIKSEPPEVRGKSWKNQVDFLERILSGKPFDMFS